MKFWFLKNFTKVFKLIASDAAPGI
jgi:hypothetical protein